MSILHAFDMAIDWLACYYYYHYYSDISVGCAFPGAKTRDQVTQLRRLFVLPEIFFFFAIETFLFMYVCAAVLFGFIIFFFSLVFRKECSKRVYYRSAGLSFRPKFNEKKGT